MNLPAWGHSGIVWIRCVTVTGRNGMLFKRKKKRKLSEDAKITQQRGRKVARWTGGSGVVTEDGKYVMVEVSTWTARFRDADGRLIERPTGCRDKSAAQARLSGWLSEGNSAWRSTLGR